MPRSSTFRSGDTLVRGNELAKLAGPFGAVQRAAAVLSLEDPDALKRAVDDGSFLGLTRCSSSLCGSSSTSAEPTTDTQRLQVVLAVLCEHDPWSVALLLRVLALDLNGRTPLEVAGGNEDDEALRRFALQVHWEWSAGSNRHQADVLAVLAWRKSYDDVGGDAQALVREEWDRRLEVVRSALGLEAELGTQGARGPRSTRTAESSGATTH